MQRPSVSFFRHVAFFWGMFASLACFGLAIDSVYAQQAGGHGGAGGAGHVSPPASHAPAPVAHAPIPHPAPSARPPVATPLPRPPVFTRPAPIPVQPPPGFLLRPHVPFYRPAPIVVPVPIFPGRFGFWGSPFWGIWPGWGLTPDVWPGCGWSANWNAGCAVGPFYDANAGIFSPYSLAPGNPPSQAVIQNLPIYYSGEGGSQSVELFLKDGTVHRVTDYWVEGGVLHFKTAEENFTKVVEHTIGFDQLDLQQTIDVNTERGYRFVLRNAPLEEYLKKQFQEPGSSSTEPAAEPQTTEPQ